MAIHQERRRVPHGCQDIFTLVSDVRDYPNFIKWIRAMRVFDENVVNGVGTLNAEAIVGYKFVRERFATTVRLNEPEGEIDVSFLSGPFSKLENRWRLQPLPDGATEVEFFIEFEFRNRILQALFDANFDRASNKLMAAFEARAAERFPTVEGAELGTSQI